MAGGCSLVLFRDSPVKEAAWRLVQFLSEAKQQLEFYDRSGNLPALVAAWEAPVLAEDRWTRPFRRQLEHVAPLPRVPEWERIATEIYKRAETAIYGQRSLDSMLGALDTQVDAILEKRRWRLARLESGR